MYGLNEIANAVSQRPLNRKELKHYLKYHLKAFSANYLNNRRTFNETEFQKIVEFAKFTIDINALSECLRLQPIPSDDKA